MKIHYRSF